MLKPKGTPVYVTVMNGKTKKSKGLTVYGHTAQRVLKDIRDLYAVPTQPVDAKEQPQAQPA